MNNNPVRYNDPSGHKACDEQGCDGEIRYKKRTSPPPPQPPQPAQTWHFSRQIDLGYHIGGSPANAPDQSSDDFLTLNEASICGTRQGAPVCALALFLRFGFVGPQNTDANFWVHFTATYDETAGIAISDMTLVNYSGDYLDITGIIFESGNQPPVRPVGSVRLSSGFGSDFSVPNPPQFNGNDPLTITLEYEETINLGSAVFPGPSRIYPDIRISLPSLPALRYFMQTGQPLPLFPFP